MGGERREQTGKVGVRDNEDIHRPYTPHAHTRVPLPVLLVKEPRSQKRPWRPDPESLTRIQEKPRTKKKRAEMKKVRLKGESIVSYETWLGIRIAALSPCAPLRWANNG